MTNYEKGKEYEEKALKILENNGFSLCLKNYKNSYGEIDLIVKNDLEIVFVEVKYRKNKKYGTGLEAINIKKAKRIYMGAQEFLLKNENFYKSYRFDLIIFEGEQYNWIKNCFWGDELGF